ncbi:MAG TPA: hypothetical protein VMZ29_03435 [Candidatus Bathyarchaeia archaeon]|nr:hypothetical protein [Candidatus Bathyarchaeia archaeon]
MVTISELYELSENYWKEYFILFKACAPEVFHTSVIEGIWSPEKILRHLLGSLIQINNNALKTEKLESYLNFDFTVNPDDKFSLEQIEKEYYRLNEVIHKGIAEITEELENEIIILGKEEIKRGRFLLLLFAHEHSHFGQVTWILKRATNWTHQDMRKIMKEKS